MIAWLTSSWLGKMILTFFVSMVPVLELRGGIPMGVAWGLSLPWSVCAAVLGNIVPAPFIVIFIRQIFAWMRRKSAWMERRIEWLEARAAKKQEIVARYAAFGLFLLVAIPLPGTGMWTGALIAGLLGLRLKQVFPPLALGVCAAAAIVTVVTYGAVRLF
jgi:uncharacterized membrane protein